MSGVTKIESLPVSQSSNPDHQVSGAYHYVSGRIDRFVFDCACGYSSPACGTVGALRSDWRRHVGLVGGEGIAEDASRS